LFFLVFQVLLGVPRPMHKVAIMKAFVFRRTKLGFVFGFEISSLALTLPIHIVFLLLAILLNHYYTIILLFSALLEST
jgi:hypothetical protein